MAHKPVVGATIESEGRSDLSNYRTARCASPVVIKNCVATAFFGCTLDLQEIAWNLFAEFDPHSFAAAKLRLVEPQATALLFASGKIVCTGAPSEESARVAVTKIYQLVSSHMAPGTTSLLDVKIENIVGTAYLGHSLSLRRAYEWMRESGDVTVMWSPELFPGMRFEIKRWAKQHAERSGCTHQAPTTKILAFQDGNVVITGGKNRTDLSISWSTIRDLLAPFAPTETVNVSFFCPRLKS